MKTYTFVLIFTFLLLSNSARLFASESNWHIAYSENSGIALMKDYSSINSVLKSDNLPVIPNSEVSTSMRSLIFSSTKWMFALGKSSLHSGKANSLNAYDSYYIANGWLFRCGYNVLSAKKSDLYLIMGGGRLNSLGTVRSNVETNLSTIDNLFLYGNERIEFDQDYTSVTIGLSYLYPLFTNILNCVELQLGVNSSYAYNIGTSSKLNGQSFKLENNKLSGFSFGLVLNLSLDLARIVNP